MLHTVGIQAFCIFRQKGSLTLLYRTQNGLYQSNFTDATFYTKTDDKLRSSLKLIENRSQH